MSRKQELVAIMLSTSIPVVIKKPFSCILFHFLTGNAHVDKDSSHQDKDSSINQGQLRIGLKESKSPNVCTQSHEHIRKSYIGTQLLWGTRKIRPVYVSLIVRSS
uniref:Uncharacterized protein n=1 Tax=Cacopsylla melanoneura TaxID=428564 RepID=A0A8D8LA63_9HEMI